MASWRRVLLSGIRPTTSPTPLPLTKPYLTQISAASCAHLDGYDFGLGQEGGGLAEVLHDLEELLAAQGLVGAEGAVGIALDDAQLIGLDDIVFRGVGEIVCPLGLNAVAGDLLQRLDSQLAHLAAGDVLGEIHTLEGVGQETQLLHLPKAWLKPGGVAGAHVGGKGGGNGSQQQSGGQEQWDDSRFEFHDYTSMESPTGQWSEPRMSR